MPARLAWCAQELRRGFCDKSGSIFDGKMGQILRVMYKTPSFVARITGRLIQKDIKKMLHKSNFTKGKPQVIDALRRIQEAKKSSFSNH